MSFQQILNATQAIDESIKVIGCVFNHVKYAEGVERVYSYKCTAEQLERIELIRAAHGHAFAIVEAVKGFKVVEIVDTDQESQEIDYSTDINYKWIVDVLEVQDYQERTEQDAVHLAAIKKDHKEQLAAQLTTQLSEKTKKAIGYKRL